MVSHAREAESWPAIAIAGFRIGFARMGQVRAAGGHGEIGPETQFTPFWISEQEGARADLLARAFEEQVSRLDQVGRDMVETGLLEHRHDTGILRFERQPLT